MSDKKYSNLHPKELERLMKLTETPEKKFKKKLKNAVDAMYKGTLTSVSTQKKEREKLRKEAIEEARKEALKHYKKK